MLKMIIHPNIILSTKCKPVEKINMEVEKQLRDMLKYCENSFSSVGLAANQVGFNNRIILAKLDNEWIPMINPEILSSTDEQYEKEGCLSVPKYFERVKRAKSIMFSYQDLDMKICYKSLSGFEAVIIQHEIDHLDGIVFVQHLPKIKRADFMKKYKKILKHIAVEKKAVKKNIK